ncbi:hypothetical protein [Bosea sp. TND4EK4]|uniref:hypothetical protein n=1 Tax=Bosea sp. TND4EK4 TaxID=1907408 RepID=UPI0009573F11|nr:hypothetical protein [Bosea sp. TND4EK4]SIP95501.1 hypothetical protein SAMN05880592_101316 [Bosea sp. TND4EK4]
MSVLLSKAEHGQCRWIVCEPVPARKGEPRDIFNGRRVCGAPVLRNSSYCLSHHMIAYAPVASAPAPAHDFTVVRRTPGLETLPELTDIFE